MGLRETMRNVHEDIKSLEKEILQTEDKIIEYLSKQNNKKYWKTAL